MGLNAKDVPFGGNSKPADPVDSGSYPARLVQLIDLGIQEQTYNGETKPPKQEIMTTYEALDEFMKDEEGNDIPEKPRWFSENFALNNLGSELAKSTKRYYALDPNENYGGDWAKLVATPCMITLVQNPGKGANKDRIYNKIANVSAMRPREVLKAHELVNEPKVLSLDSTDTETFQSLPDWVQKKIKSSLEWESTALYAALQKVPAKKKEEVKKSVKDDIPSEDTNDEDDGNW